MSELDEKLDRFIKSVDLRLGEIKRQLKEQRRADERILEDFNLPPNLSHVGTGISPQPHIDEDSLTLAQRKYSNLCRRTHLVLIRIHSKRFEQRQRYRRRGVQPAVLQRTDSRSDVVFLGLVEVVNVGRTTTGHRTGTCSSHLLTRPAREDNDVADNNAGTQ